MDKDFAEFQSKIQDLDRRLATILCQGFDDCNSLASAVKVPALCGQLGGRDPPPGGVALYE